MARRQQKLSRAKSRTAWLAWCAWGVFGSIFLFEDTFGGSGVFAWIFTAPFWVMFALWPLIWVWLKTRRNEALVEADDDISTEDAACRLIQKDGLRYVERESFEKAFGILLKGPFEKIAGGDEDFVLLASVEPLAKDNKKLQQWLELVATIPLVH